MSDDRIPVGSSVDDGRGSAKVPLSSRQADALAVIRTHVAQHGYPPSVRELAQGLGLRSPSSAHHLLTQLEKKGHIRRRGGFARALDVQARPLPPTDLMTELS